MQLDTAATARSPRRLPSAILVGLLAVSTLALAVPARADLVEVGFGTGNTHIQDAIDVAQDGDVILAQVVSYEYTSFEIVNKSLTILSEGPLPIVGHVVVRDLEAGKRVVIKNLVADPFFAEHPIQILDCEGDVVLEGCSFAAPDGTGEVLHGALVENSASVSFTTSELIGGRAEFCAEPGPCATSASGSGLRAVNSRVELQDCDVEGGRGVDSGSGADGLVAIQSIVSASGTRLVRGVGGTDDDGFPLGTDGFGLHVTSGGYVRLRDSVVHGLTVADADQVETLDVPASSVRLPAPVRLGQEFSLLVGGASGHVAQLWLSLDAGWFDLPQHSGVLLLAPPFLVSKPLQLGVLGDPGSTPPALRVNDIAGLDSLVVHAQIVTFDGAQAHLGGRSTLVLVDDGR